MLGKAINRTARSQKLNADRYGLENNTELCRARVVSLTALDLCILSTSIVIYSSPYLIQFALHVNQMCE